MCLLWVSQTLFPFRLLTQSNQIRIGYLLLSVLDLLAITHAMTEPSAQTVLYGFELINLTTSNALLSGRSRISQTGAPTAEIGSKTYYSAKIFAEICMKVNGIQGATHPWHSPLICQCY